MLIEIFSDKVYENTVADTNRGIKSRRVPSTHISEKGRVIDYYIKARNFLIDALDNDYTNLKRGGSYMLEIEKQKVTNGITSSLTPSAYIDEYEFSFKFNSLRDTTDEDKAYTIHGSLIVDDHFNVIEFKRDRVKVVVPPSATVTVTTRIVTDSTSTSGRRIEHVESQGENAHPFDSGCQQKEPCDTDKGAGSDTTDESESIELSENSFSVKGTAINIIDPKLEIGTVEGGSFSVDEEKQRMQDEFLANMSRKISKRNRRRGAK